MDTANATIVGRNIHQVASGPLRILKMYRLYDEYIDRDFSLDYWSDEGVSQAALILIKFTDSDWDILAKLCLSKSEKWGIRCADTLGDIEGSKALIVLLKLLKSVSPDVRMAALDSIRSLMASGTDISAYVQEISDAVISIKASESVDHVVELALVSLEKKLVHMK
ncbi:hypothetical protein [uncultured Herbaspirillum sp.]|uniref:hypothetical protein n=1 Tax=uncultured Herbaspirillum sp. TaxID=160236 RepID=UPI002585D6E9|nr:hypothetical protein [uncultured Herbaspirillum sp.]